MGPERRRQKLKKRVALLCQVGLCTSLVAAAAAPAIASASAYTASTVTITTGKVKRGTVVVSSSGLTLYGFAGDHGSSTCSGTCAKTWIPWLTHGGVAVKAGSGLNQQLVGKTRRSNGTYQVTYGGHPLYHYVGDKKAGTQNGEAKKQFGAYWYLVSKQGKFMKPSSGLIGGY